MTAHDLFLIATYGVLPFWLLLIVLPRWRGTTFLVHSVAMPVLLGLFYVGLIAAGALTSGDVPPEAGFGSLEGVMAFFTVERAVLAGWAHYLVFDLFVGAWIGRDGIRRDMTHWVTAPCLVVTLFFGPAGLLLYLLLRALFGKGGWYLFEH